MFPTKVVEKNKTPILCPAYFFVRLMVFEIIKQKIFMLCHLSTQEPLG
jgi:hypothetical protein